MYVIGIGKTKFGVSSQNLIQLASEAIDKALEDSHLSKEDIQAVYVGNFLGGILQNQLHLNSVISGLFPNLHLPIIRVETACASSSAALYQALLAVHRFEHILVLGVEKMTGYDIAVTSKAIAAAGEVDLDQKSGLSFPSSYAFIAQRYFEKYGATTDDLDLISFKAHQNANLNHLAHFHHKQIELHKIKSSAVVSSPLKLFDCSPISDGAAAIIISNKKHSERDVEIIGSSLKTDFISLSQRDDFTSFTAAKLAAHEAYQQAHLSPADVHVAEVHDCFTIAEMVAMEDLGFCQPGESKEWIRTGKTTLQGRLPINTGGGLKANGHPIGATGVSQVCEIVTQLRGEAGSRQVKNATIGLTHNIGGVGGTAVVHILKKG